MPYGSWGALEQSNMTYLRLEPALLVEKGIRNQVAWKSGPLQSRRLPN